MLSDGEKSARIRCGNLRTRVGLEWMGWDPTQGSASLYSTGAEGGGYFQAPDWWGRGGETECPDETREVQSMLSPGWIFPTLGPWGS